MSAAFETPNPVRYPSEQRRKAVMGYHGYCVEVSIGDAAGEVKFPVEDLAALYSQEPDLYPGLTNPYDISDIDRRAL